MRSLTVNPKNIFILLSMAILTPLLFAYTAYSDANGLLKQQSQSASPGYLNAAKQKTDYIINQAPKENSFFQGVIEYLKDGLSFKIAEGGRNEDDPDLKKKTSSSDNVQTAGAAGEEIPEPQIVDSTRYEIEGEMKNGESQVLDQTGRLIAEDINGVTHIYVGFDDVGASSIQKAIDMAEAGDIILVASGTYSGYFSVKNGVRLYGGYNNNGARDINSTATTIVGGFSADNIRLATEINGFTIKTSSGITPAISISNSSDALKIINNTVTYNGIYERTSLSIIGIKATDNSQAIIYNNKIAGAYKACCGAITCCGTKNSIDYAIWASDSSLKVERNIITNAMNGIYEISGNSIFENNVLLGNYYNFTFDRSNAVLNNNTVSGRLDLRTYGRGIMSFNSYIQLTNNIFDDNIYYIIAISDVEAMPIVDGPDISLTQIVAEGNIFTTNSAMLGISRNLFQEANDFLYTGVIDAITYEYSSDLLADKGYSSDNVKENYTQLTFTDSTGQTQIMNDLDNRNIGDLWYQLHKLNYYQKQSLFNINQDFSYEDLGAGKGISGQTILNLFKGLMENKDTLFFRDTGKADESLIANVVAGALDKSALSIPVENAETVKSYEMRIALMLAQIIKDPTEEQNAVLDALADMLEDSKSGQKDAGSEKLSIAQDEFVQMFTKILLSQAIPGLLKEGDMEGMRMLFLELNEEKSHVLSEYKKSIKVYYDSVVEELANNIAILQLKGILSKDMISDELRKMPRGDIDKILQEIKAKKERTEKEEYILEKEAEYERQYITPGKIFLEENMRRLLQDFTRKLNAVLQGEDLAKKDTKESSIK